MTTPTTAPKSFRTPAAFRAWLEKHHGKAKELEIRLFKVHAAHRGITYAQALDEALCFGWIDGVIHSPTRIASASVTRRASRAATGAVATSSTWSG